MGHRSDLAPRRRSPRRASRSPEPSVSRGVIASRSLSAGCGLVGHAIPVSGSSRAGPPAAAAPVSPMQPVAPPRRVQRRPAARPRDVGGGETSSPGARRASRTLWHPLPTSAPRLSRRTGPAAGPTHQPRLVLRWSGSSGGRATSTTQSLLVTSKNGSEAPFPRCRRQSTRQPQTPNAGAVPGLPAPISGRSRRPRRDRLITSPRRECRRIPGVHQDHPRASDFSPIGKSASERDPENPA